MPKVSIHTEQSLWTASPPPPTVLFGRQLFPTHHLIWRSDVSPQKRCTSALLELALDPWCRAGTASNTSSHPLVRDHTHSSLAQLLTHNKCYQQLLIFLCKQRCCNYKKAVRASVSPLCAGLSEDMLFWSFYDYGRRNMVSVRPVVGVTSPTQEQDFRKITHPKAGEIIFLKS